MNEPTIYYQGSSLRKLSSIRKLAERLLNTLEEQESELPQGQCMEALRSLLSALSLAIQTHQERELRGKTYNQK